MRRREFVMLVAGAAAWPHVVRAQQPERIRRIGVLYGGPNDTNFRSKIAMFQQTLQQLGWVDGRNIEFNIRWGGNDAERIMTEAREVVRARPDVILVGPSSALAPLKKETDSIPIVFVQVSDPLGQGVVESLARPTGNITGFSNLEFSLIGKYLQILREIAPSTTRVAVMIHTSNAVSANWFRMFNTVAPSFAIEPITAPIRDLSDIERTIESLARGPNGGRSCRAIRSLKTLVSGSLLLNWRRRIDCPRCTLLENSFVMVGLCLTELISSTNFEAPHPT